MRTCAVRLEELAAPEALRRALRAASRGRRRRPDVAWALFRAEELVADLSERLRSGAWSPCTPRVHVIQTPKPRPIARPLFADRVVHAAIVQALEPWWRRRARPESFACRPGGGVHRAVLHLQRAMRRHERIVHLDLRAYFPSVDPAVVHSLLDRTLRDQRLVHLVDRVVASGAGVYRRADVRAALGLTAAWPPTGHGLALGSSVSRWLANHVLLDALDHHVTRELRVPGYARYLDDLFLLGDGRASSRDARDAVVAWLREERGLRVKDEQAPLRRCAGGLEALGHVLGRERIEPRPRTWRRLRARVRGLARARRVGWKAHLGRSMASTAGGVLFGV